MKQLDIPAVFTLAWFCDVRQASKENYFKKELRIRMETRQHKLKIGLRCVQFLGVQIPHWSRWPYSAQLQEVHSQVSERGKSERRPNIHFSAENPVNPSARSQTSKISQRSVTAMVMQKQKSRTLHVILQSITWQWLFHMQKWVHLIYATHYYCSIVELPYWLKSFLSHSHLSALISFPVSHGSVAPEGCWLLMPITVVLRSPCGM